MKTSSRPNGDPPSRVCPHDARYATIVLFAMMVATPGATLLGETGSASAETTAVPKLEFDPAAPTFGVIRRFGERNRTFEVKVHNRSDAPFDLQRVAIGCGCMLAEVVSPGPIKPGEAGTLRITLDRNRVRVGDASYPLSIVEREKHVAYVPVTYSYDPAVYADQTELFIDTDDASGDAPLATTTVRVRRPGPGGNATPRASSENQHFQATLRQGVGAEPGQYQLEVTSAGDGPPIGNVRGTIAIHLPGSAEPDLTLPLHCTVRPPVSAHPEAVLLKPGRAGKEVRRTFRLASRRPFAVKSVTSSSADMTVKEQGSGEKRGEGDTVERTYELIIRPADRAAGTFAAEVRVDIETPAAFQLVVPVVGDLDPAK